MIIFLASLAQNFETETHFARSLQGLLGDALKDADAVVVDNAVNSPGEAVISSPHLFFRMETQLYKFLKNISLFGDCCSLLRFTLSMFIFQ